MPDTRPKPKPRKVPPKAAAPVKESRTLYATALTKPFVRHGVVGEKIAGQMLGQSPNNPDYLDYADAIRAKAGDASKGDMAMASEMLTAQAISLDSIFTEMVRRSALNMGEYLDASERYMRLALKAQANSRATLAELAKLHQPREQTVRHVHVNEGGQAIVADQFHQHTGGKENAKSDEQPHATGTGAAGSGPALLGHDAQGNGVPVPGGKRKETVSNARRQRQRCAKG